LELQFNNLQVLCEDCNCGLKGTLIVDYRRVDHIKLIESTENGKYPLTLQQKMFLTEVEDKKSDTEKEIECRRTVRALSNVKPQQVKLRRLNIAISKYGETAVRQQLEKI